jgi:hypothetical protein
LRERYRSSLGQGIGSIPGEQVSSKHPMAIDTSELSNGEWEEIFCNSQSVQFLEATFTSFDGFLPLHPLSVTAIASPYYQGHLNPGVNHCGVNSGTLICTWSNDDDQVWIKPYDDSTVA